MIEYIKGILISKKPAEAIIESSGIGYSVYITLPAFETLPAQGEQAKIITHLQIKENPFAIVLYGFSDESERECFRQIITVSGIGPRTAMSILSAIDYREFTSMIAQGNYLPLTSISGVGKKTAERLALELKDKLAKTVGEISAANLTDGRFAELGRLSEVIQALVSLGYNRLEADKLVRAASVKPGFAELSAEDVIKGILRGK
jgi:Holliday junction DNA helicase RuvA